MGVRMINIDITLLVQFINFVITLFVLNILLVRPIRDILKKRAGAMADLVGETERFSQSAEEKLKNYEAALDEARKAGTAERLRYKDEGLAKEKEIMSAANAKAQEGLAAARSEIESQSQTAMKSLKGQVDKLAKKAVAKILS